MEHLTPQLVYEAQQGKPHHPIVDILTMKKEGMLTIENELEELGDFGLSSSDFISIWAQDSVQAAERLDRYRLAEQISRAYLKPDVAQRMNDLLAIDGAITEYILAHPDDPAHTFLSETVENLRGGLYTVQMELELDEPTQIHSA